MSISTDSTFIIADLSQTRSNKTGHAGKEIMGINSLFIPWSVWMYAGEREVLIHSFLEWKLSILNADKCLAVRSAEGRKDRYPLLYNKHWPINLSADICEIPQRSPLHPRKHRNQGEPFHSVGETCLCSIWIWKVKKGEERWGIGLLLFIPCLFCKMQLVPRHHADAFPLDRQNSSELVWGRNWVLFSNILIDQIDNTETDSATLTSIQSLQQ